MEHRQGRMTEAGTGTMLTPAECPPKPSRRSPPVSTPSRHDWVALPCARVVDVGEGITLLRVFGETTINIDDEK